MDDSLQMADSHVRGFSWQKDKITENLRAMIHASPPAS